MTENAPNNLDLNQPTAKRRVMFIPNYLGTYLIRLIVLLFDSLHFLLAPQVMLGLIDEEFEQTIHNQIIPRAKFVNKKG